MCPRGSRAVDERLLERVRACHRPLDDVEDEARRAIARAGGAAEEEKSFDRAPLAARKVCFCAGIVDFARTPRKTSGASRGALRRSRDALRAASTGARARDVGTGVASPKKLSSRNQRSQRKTSSASKTKMPVRRLTASVNSSRFKVSDALPLESKTRSTVPRTSCARARADELFDRAGRRRSRRRPTPGSSKRSPELEEQALERRRDHLRPARPPRRARRRPGRATRRSGACARARGRLPSTRRRRARPVPAEAVVGRLLVEVESRSAHARERARSDRRSPPFASRISAMRARISAASRSTWAPRWPTSRAAPRCSSGSVCPRSCCARRAPSSRPAR